MATETNEDTSQINILLESTNIAESLSDALLDEIGQKCVDDFEEDLESRSDWEESNEEWLKLAAQTMETKNYPWPDASNVKFPLLATAALQFHARAYPALIPDTRVVKTRVVGKDDEKQTKRKRAERVAQHMSYQLLSEMDGWQEDMDRMMYILPIIGVAFKKTYYSPDRGTNISELISPQDLVVNYYADDFAKARKSHRMYLNQNDVLEYVNQGIYIDADLTEPQDKQHEGVVDEVVGLSPSIPDEDMPYEIIEQHRYYDLDDDGYQEPYIVTVDRESGKVLRIVARFEQEGIKQDAKGKVLKITPLEYFTQYSFIPNPDSKIYSLGFGTLIGPTNSAINTILNQLLDAGHLSNLQGGFLGRGARVRGGRIQFKPGEWKAVQATGDDLRKSIYPMPVREPSSVLFQLLGMLIESGERLASVKDIMVGENPGQNQPYSTTVAVMEQGMKVFVSIYKRIFRALDKEYKKIYRLNHMYLKDEDYFLILDSGEEGIIAKEDYDGSDRDIIPGADPSSISEAHKMMKANSLLQKMSGGMPLNPTVVMRLVLEAEGHDNIDELMDAPPPQPDFDTQLKMREFEHRQQMEQMEIELRIATTKHEALKDFAAAMHNLAKAEATGESIEREDIKAMVDIALRQEGELTKRLQVIGGMAKDAAADASEGAEKTEETVETPTEE